MDILQSLQNTLDRFLEYIPQIIGAVVILLVGYLIARALQAVVAQLLQTIGFDRWIINVGCTTPAY